MKHTFIVKFRINESKNNRNDSFEAFTPQEAAELCREHYADAINDCHVISTLNLDTLSTYSF